MSDEFIPCSCAQPCALARMGLPGGAGCRGVAAFERELPAEPAPADERADQPAAGPDGRRSGQPYWRFSPGPRRVLAVASALLAVAFMVMAFVLTWPVQWGGQFTLAGVSGKSMEPTYHNSDLIVARKQDQYRIGDIIVYDVDYLGTRGRVVHRIVEIKEDGSFVTRGDNNHSNDPWQVQPEWIRGGEAFLVPNGAVIPALLQSPILIGSMTTLLVIYLLWPRGDSPSDEDEADGNEGQPPQTQPAPTQPAPTDPGGQEPSG